MSNIRRFYEENAAYFLTTVTNERVELFKDPKSCKILLITLEYFKIILDYRLYGFCIMPEHLHLIIHPFGKYNFSYIMKMLKGSFARKLNKINGREGKIWQKGFYDECITDSVKLIQKLEYIHNNPVKDNLVSAPEEFLFSSYNHYFQTAYQPNHIIEIDKPML
ncbi:MAG: transposase [Candidatus Omnitrophica bacterium]|nr:transposase [Candidatus Omnitrophota bacterium]